MKIRKEVEEKGTLVIWKNPTMMPHTFPHWCLLLWASGKALIFWRVNWCCNTFRMASNENWKRGGGKRNVSYPKKSSSNDATYLSWASRKAPQLLEVHCVAFLSKIGKEEEKEMLFIQNNQKWCHITLHLLSHHCFFPRLAGKPLGSSGASVCWCCDTLLGVPN